MPNYGVPQLRSIVDPSICHLCKEPISKNQTWDVHHKNGDHHDDRKRNLSAVHHGCHTRVHAPWRFVTQEGIERRAVLHTGQKRPSQTKAMKRAWAEGRMPGRHSEETKAKMSSSKKGQHKGWSWKVIDGKRVWIEK